jgi:hypothetical protein
VSLRWESLRFQLAGTLPPSHCKAPLFCSRGGTGRRVRLRTVWGDPWRFESSREQLFLSHNRPFRSTSNCSMLIAIPVAYFAPALLLAAQRAFISSESLFRPAGVSAPFFRLEAFFAPPAFLLAAQRAFISWESFLRPAGVSCPFLLAGAAPPVPRLLAQRALAAAESFALVAGEK